MQSASGRRFPLIQGHSWAIGRGEGCAVMLDSRSVSRLHALIQRGEGGAYSLVDLGSRNGSFVNKQRVSVPVVLKDRDQLLFGDQSLLFQNPLDRPSAPQPLDASTRNAPTTALLTQSLATIAVVDIRDYTPLARAVSESLLSQTIGTWFLRVGQIAQQHGSWAQKYIGDAVMMVWVHDEEIRLRADLMLVLKAISEISTATTGIHQGLPLPGPLRVGAGINTGTAILGGTDYTALGDTVNAAFRLEAATKMVGMGVVIGDATLNALGVSARKSFARRQVDLKGYESPYTAWAISFAGLQEFLTGAS
jgi:adenylate cyclase